ncbi:MAG: hypothetical protein RKP20_18615 [Candidatus Competibacter sp.]|nr:hypothetical protein [Candidatus Competibacter sp.]
MSMIAWVMDANRGWGQAVAWKLPRDRQRHWSRRGDEAVAWRGSSQ